MAGGTGCEPRATTYPHKVSVFQGTAMLAMTAIFNHNSNLKSYDSPATSLHNLMMASSKSFSIVKIPFLSLRVATRHVFEFGTAWLTALKPTT